MKNLKNTIRILLIIGLPLLLLLGIYNIFSLRFSRGDLYPEYSSYRPDPVGCKALHDSLGELGIVMERHFEKIGKLKQEPNSILIRTGINSISEIYQDESLHSFIMNGGTFIGFFHASARKIVYAKVAKKSEEIEEDEKCEKESEVDKIEDELNDDDGKEDAEEQDEYSDEDSDTDIESEKISTPSDRFKAILSCELSNKSKEKDAKGAAIDIAKPTELLTKNGSYIAFPTFSKNTFQVDDNVWSVLYSTNDAPVMIKRKIGQGYIVLSNSTYFITNEGLKKHRANALIAYLIGDSHRVIFDEYSLGVQENRNIAWLFKKFNLHYLLINLGLIVLLFLWYNFGSLSNLSYVRENSYLESGVIDSKLSSSSGLLNIISKSIKPKELLNISIAEWRKTVKIRNIPKVKLDKIDKIIAENKSSNPVMVYKLIEKVLKRKK